MQSLASNTFTLTFADPPFNIGHGYSGYHDKQTRDNFVALIRGAVKEMWRVTDQVLALHGPDDLCELYLELAREFKMPRIAWVNWCFSFGRYNKEQGAWANARCHCLIFAKRNYKWNPDAVAIPSVRMLIGDKRAKGPRLPSTIWGLKTLAEDSDIPVEPIQNEASWNRVQGNNRERVPDRPNQLPEAYLRRLILAYTDAGDKVLDPYGGTGTTAVVSESLGRQATTIDIDPEAIQAIHARLKKGVVK